MGAERGAGDGADGQEEDEDLCLVCLTEPVSASLTHTTTPTSHACVCLVCAYTLLELKESDRKCPLCREPIATVVQEREDDWTQKPSADETKAKRKTRSRNWQLRNNKQV